MSHDEKTEWPSFDAVLDDIVPEYEGRRPDESTAASEPRESTPTTGIEAEPKTKADPLPKTEPKARSKDAKSKGKTKAAKEGTKAEPESEATSADKADINPEENAETVPIPESTITSKPRRKRGVPFELPSDCLLYTSPSPRDRG